MNKNRLIYIAVALVLAIMLLLSVRTVVATNAVVSQGSDLSDYALRHPDARIVIPAVSPDLSDYALRHPDARIGVAPANPDLSDYGIRHPDAHIVVSSTHGDMSDYALRHPDARIVIPAVSPDLSDYAALQDQLAELRAATAQFHRPDVDRAAGYTLVKGLDYCFNYPGIGGMGFHLIKTSSLDLTVKALEPEAMVYAPGPNGQLQLGAVEYIVPAAAWDAAGNTQPPSVLGQRFHLNSVLGVYILHAWIWQDNPLGMFQDWNPKVSCR